MATTSTQDARIRELLLVNLFAVFSEPDPERRMRAIVANYTEDVIWSSPEVTARGHEELNAAVLIAERGDDLAVQKRPCRISVQQQEGAAGSLIDVVDPGAVQIEEAVLDREEPAGDWKRERGHRCLPAKAQHQVTA